MSRDVFSVQLEICRDDLNYLGYNSDISDEDMQKIATHVGDILVDEGSVWSALDWAVIKYEAGELEDE